MTSPRSRRPIADKYEIRSSLPRDLGYSNQIVAWFLTAT